MEPKIDYILEIKVEISTDNPRMDLEKRWSITFF